MIAVPIVDGEMFCDDCDAPGAAWHGDANVATLRCARCAQEVAEDAGDDGPTITLSFAVLPTSGQFHRHYEAYVGPFDEADFYLELKGEDLDAVQADARADVIYAGPRDYDGQEIWDLVRALTDAFEIEGDEVAGSLASAILGIIGIEWV